jgi:hypothetical protein
MKAICILFLLSFSKAEAWVSVSSSPLLVHTRHRQTALGATTEESAMRRTFLLSSTAAFIVSFVPPMSTAAAGEQDPLEAFGKTLSTTPPSQLGGWPHSPSPLPTSVKSAAELTAPSTPLTMDPVSASDLIKALEESSKKKKVDPRTHG